MREEKEEEWGGGGGGEGRRVPKGGCDEGTAYTLVLLGRSCLPRLALGGRCEQAALEIGG